MCENESRLQDSMSGFSGTICMKRRFIRVVVPLQLTDGAMQEDITQCGTLPSY